MNAGRGESGHDQAPGATLWPTHRTDSQNKPRLVIGVWVQTTLNPKPLPPYLMEARVLLEQHAQHLLCGGLREVGRKQDFVGGRLVGRTSSRHSCGPTNYSTLHLTTLDQRLCRQQSRSSSSSSSSSSSGGGRVSMVIRATALASSQIESRVAGNSPALHQRSLVTSQPHSFPK